MLVLDCLQVEMQCNCTVMRLNDLLQPFVQARPGESESSLPLHVNGTNKIGVRYSTIHRLSHAPIR